MGTLIASREGATKLQKARDSSGRTVDSPRWLEEASKLLDPEWESGNSYYADGVNEGSWRRFLYRSSPIREEIFKAYCSVLGLSWEEIASNFSEVNNFSQLSLFALDDFWVGRANLLEDLKKILQSPCRVLMLTGMTGVGKTALTEKLVMDLQFLPNLCRINLDYREKSTEFSNIAAYLLEGWKQPISESDRRDSQRLLNRTVNYLQHNSYILLIDALENALVGNAETGWSEFIDPLWIQFFQKLFSAEFCATKVILTSQHSPAQLVEIGGRYRSLHCSVLSGLTEEEQLSLFKQIGLQIKNPEVRGYLSRIGYAYEGHPLALRVIGGEIAQAPFNGDVQLYWKQYGHEVEWSEQFQQQTDWEGRADSLRLAQYSRSLRQRVKQRIEQVLRRLSHEIPLAYVLLCVGAAYRRPVTEQFWLRVLEGRVLNEAQQFAVLDALYDRYLVESVVIDGDLMIRQHNLIRSIALEHLRNLQP